MRTLKRTRSRKLSKKQQAELAAQEALAETLDAQEKARAAREKRDRLVAGTVAARLGIVAYELDLLVAACGNDLDVQSLAWLKTQAMFFHGASDQWRLRSEGTQWALAK